MNVELKTALAQNASPTQQLVVALKPLSRYGKLVYLSMQAVSGPSSEALLSEMTGLDLADVRMTLEELSTHGLVDEKCGLVPRRFRSKKG